MSVSIVGDRHQSRMLSNSASVLAAAVTLLAERHSAPCCATDSREGVRVNTFGVIENTLGLFKITFGVLYFSASKLGV